MPYLIGLALGAALLYFWLQGHWFARVLAFLALTPVGTILAGVAVNAVTGATMDKIMFPCIVAGGVAAWFASGMPMKVQERKATAPLGNIILTTLPRK